MLLHLHVDLHRRRSVGTVSDFAAVAAWLRAADPIDAHVASDAGPRASFAELWERIATPAVAELRGGCGDYPDSVWKDLGDDLIARLADVGEPVLWYLFNLRRTPGDVVAALLSEDPVRPRGVYCGWLEEIRADGMAAVVATHPHLEEHLGAALQAWRTVTRDLLARIGRDDAAVRKAFGLSENAALSGVQQGLADPHPGGRTVAVLTYTAGGDDDRTVSETRLVYKTKDLRIDAAFGEILARFPAPTVGDPPLRAAAVLVRDGYGYMEWIEHRVCASDVELAAFYRNAGRLTAVLYLLCCNDCHHANLIASGDQLVMVDGETLLEGIPAVSSDAGVTTPSDLQRRIDSSVLGLGMLPQWHVAGAERAIRDMSALGIEAPATAQRPVSGWIALNTDGMISGEVVKDARAATSLPVGVGSANRLADFVDEFCEGVAGQLRAIHAVRDEWLSVDGPLPLFRGVIRRFVRRPTWVYLWLRGRLLEPAALASARVRTAVLDELGDVGPEGRRDPIAELLTAAERAQLADLHVPYFAHVTDGLAVETPEGSVAEGFYQVSGYDYMLRRFEELDVSTIALQLRLIRGVVAAKHTTSHVAAGRTPVGKGTHAASVEPLAVARSVARKLLECAITDPDGSVEWLGVHVTKNIDLTNYGAVGPGLYSGRCGIALFLHRFGTVHEGTDAERYRSMALAAVADLTVPPADGLRWWRDQPLGCAGAGGILLALRSIPTLAPDLLDRYLAGLTPTRLLSDPHLDVIFGVAGLIGPLLGIGTPAAMSLARVAGDRLVDCQQPSGGWLTDSTDHVPLTGFSHGASGIAAALAALHTRTGDHGYLAAARLGVTYERDQFDTDAHNWPDHRGRPTTVPRFMNSWCHGAPGIALSRLILMNSPLWDAAMRAELVQALLTTSQVAPPYDSLCCGRLGRAAILRMAARWLGDARWLEAAERLEHQTLAGRIGSPDYSVTELPGLMQGAAGVGLALIDREPLALLPGVLSAGLTDVFG
ncbi:type 2 lanthipeptide synthetase LanM [Mycolicibacterium hodleri]|uniref:type 2 lanthipeptide synthetase LanM n=1 Tax=Mycolicibacterium hodleri TaxID=49897 RepID=UPI001375593A|nr:type 2 lanthipeptide synthetase LanM [Mycolicibacterium hodleri]